MKGEITNDENFNPRSRVGSDAIEKTDDMIQYEFQSTLPRGERQRWLSD